MNKTTKIWKSQNGRRQRICDLNDRHLINIINLLREEATDYRSQVPYPNFSSINVQECAERQFNIMMEKDIDEFIYGICPLFEDLIDEAVNRGIDVYNNH